jgi:hypothetical protein
MSATTTTMGRFYDQERASSELRSTAREGRSPRLALTAALVAEASKAPRHAATRRSTRGADRVQWRALRAATTAPSSGRGSAAIGSSG